jgi:aspartate 1-decarboxylase
MISAEEAKTFKPSVVILDGENRIVDTDYAEKHGEIK